MPTRTSARPDTTTDVALPSHTALTAKQYATREIGRQLQTYSGVISRLLARTPVNEDTFRAQIMNAIRANPDLLGCAPETIIGAALRSAQLNLTPNDGRNLAFIIPYGGKAQWQLGYGGAMELARRAVPGLRFDGRPVYPNDEFDLDYGRTPPVKHRPAFSMGRPRGGDAFAWYVRAIFPDGTEQAHALDREGVEYHRGFSKQPNGQMWKDSYDAAALKSVVHDMKRWLPSSTEMAVAYESDDEVIDVRQVEPIEAVVRADVHSAPALIEGTEDVDAHVDAPAPDDHDHSDALPGVG